MSETTKIQWADATWNPWIGCTKVSPGCKNCYAEQTTRARVLRSKGQETWGRGARRSRTSEQYWRDPILWNRGFATANPPKRIFPSLCDWLDPEVPIEWLADFLKLIHDTPNLRWLLLTKRPENFFRRLINVYGHHFDFGSRDVAGWVFDWCERETPPSNVSIGTSVEDQPMTDQRIIDLLKIPAAVRFLSVEPMLEAIKFASWKCACGWKCSQSELPKPLQCPKCKLSEGLLWHSNIERIDWAIFGGESGPNARPCNVEWIRDGVRQCQAAGVPAFVKQLGSKPQMDVEVRCDSPALAGLRGVELRPFKLKDKKGGDMNEWPEDLRVREMPHD